MKKSELKSEITELTNRLERHQEELNKLYDYLFELEENRDEDRSNDNDDGAYDENYRACDCEVCRCDRGENLDTRNEYAGEQPQEDELPEENTIYVNITVEVRVDEV